METKKRSYLAAASFLLFALIFILLCLTISRLSERLGNGQAVAAAPVPTVVIDAGHGGEDGGAVSAEGICEKDINLRLSVLLGDMLEAAGYSVVQTRTEDKLLYDRNVNFHGRKKVLDMEARLDTASSCGASLFISIHMNSFPQAKYRGLQVYYSPNHRGSEALAQSIQALTRATLQPENHREAKSSDGNIYLLDKLRYPAVLVECGFLSNPDEARLLSDESYLKELAFAVFAAACDSLAARQGSAEA